jgi:hypothetical protein
VPSVRSRMVGRAHSSMCFRSNLPVWAKEIPVIWCTTTSGRARATVSPTHVASNPSITTPSAPSPASKSSLAEVVVLAVTSCPRATSCGTRRCPRTPLPPATKTRMGSPS